MVGHISILSQTKLTDIHLFLYEEGKQIGLQAPNLTRVPHSLANNSFAFASYYRSYIIFLFVKLRKTWLNKDKNADGSVLGLYLESSIASAHKATTTRLLHVFISFHLMVPNLIGCIVYWYCPCHACMELFDQLGFFVLSGWPEHIPSRWVWANKEPLDPNLFLL